MSANPWLRHLALRPLRRFALPSIWAVALAGCAGTSDDQLGLRAAGAGGANESAGAFSDGAAGAGRGGAASGASAGQSHASAGRTASGEGGESQGPAGAGSGVGGEASQGGSPDAASGSGGTGGAVATGGSGGARANGGAMPVGGAAGVANLPSVSVYIAGDSTVSQYVLDPKNPKSQAGWGQMLGAHYTSKVTVLDKAVGGRTARRYLQEGTLDAILKLIRPGDYLLVQFGTNDSNTTATYTLAEVEYPYFADAATDFKTYLRQYIAGATSRMAIPVLVTPPPRNSAYCNGPRSLANYGQAMIELGKAESVAVVDLGFKAHAHLSAICPKPTTGAQESFFKVNADATIDGTHFQENGARVMAGFVAEGIGEATLGLDAYLKP